MPSTLRTLAAACLLTAVPALAQDGGEPAPFELSKFHDSVLPSVVFLSVRDAFGEPLGNGSGFFVREDGLIATNHHVIEEAPNVVAVLADGTELPIESVVAEDEVRDVALIKATKPGGPPLELASMADAKAGLPVVVLSNPAGFSFTLSEGIVSAVRKDGLPEEFRGSKAWVEGPVLQFTAPTTGGSSGAPLMTREGKVLGVVQSGYSGGGNLGFAVPADAVKALLAKAGNDTPVRRFNQLPVKNLLISVALFAVFGGYLLVRGGRRKKRRELDPLN